MAVSIQQYKDKLSDNFKLLKKRKKILSNILGNNQIDITSYVIYNSTNSEDPMEILCHESFQWCFDNDIFYKIIQKTIESDMTMSGFLTFTVMGFKNKADMIAFKLQWSGEDNDFSEDIDNDKIPF